MSRATGSDLERLFVEIGHRLGQALGDGLKTALAHATPSGGGAAAARRGPGRPPRSAAEAKCIVPTCVRRSVAKKLCPTHYRKAGRLGFTGTLNAGQLEMLRKDGRATRWENARKKGSRKSK